MNSLSRKTVFFLWLCLLLNPLGSCDQVTVPVEPQLDYKVLAYPDRQSRKIRLENGLEMFLVFDPNLDDSGAALMVDSGSWDDPKDFPGMAHLLEHMLFLGSHAYPNLKGFVSFIMDRAGNTNAQTEDQNTTYYFTISQEYFLEALDQFAHFFTDPLLDTTTLGKELLVVDQEYAKSRENSFWRRYMVLSSITNPEHPAASFGMGCRKTLENIPREAVLEWFNSHYVANRMHLVIASPLPLDTVEALAREKFGSIKASSVSKPSIGIAQFSDEQKGQWLYVEPTQNLNLVSCTWELSRAIMPLDSHALHFLGYLLENHATNSLVSRLRDQGLIFWLGTQVSASADQLLFSVHISCTDEGLALKEMILAELYQTLAAFSQQGIPKWLFNEFLDLEIVRYQYPAPKSLFSQIEYWISTFIYEPFETLPVRSAIAHDWDSELFLGMVDQLRPDRAIYTVLAHPENVKKTFPSSEKWSYASYLQEPIDGQTMRQWKAIFDNQPKPVALSPNPFIAHDFSLLEVELLPFPEQQVDAPRASWWYVADHPSSSPTAACYVTWEKAGAANSGEDMVQLFLLADLLSLQLDHVFGLAEQAGYSCHLSATADHVYLRLSGFSQTIEALFHEVDRAIVRHDFSENLFCLVKKKLQDRLEDSYKQLALWQAFNALEERMTGQISAQEAGKILEKIDRTSFLEWVENFVKTLYSSAVWTGNISPDHVRSIWESSDLATAPWESIDEEVFLRSRPSFQDGLSFFDIEQRDILGTALVAVAHLGEATPKNRVCQLLFNNALAPLLFFHFRTDQQIAYITRTFAIDDRNTLFEAIGIQSTLPVERLMDGFNAFFAAATSRWDEVVGAERFEELKSSLLSELCATPTNLWSSTSYWYSLIFEKGELDWMEQLYEVLEPLTYADFLDQINNMLGLEPSLRYALGIQGKEPIEQSQGQ